MIPGGGTAPGAADILRAGDAAGNGMRVRVRLPSGLTVYGLPTENHYGGHWDLGPTWNYVVMTDPPFLVDAGRRGQGRRLAGMLTDCGAPPAELGAVVVTHGHEDHDGGLAELAGAAGGIDVRAHRVYRRLVRRYPGKGPAGGKGRFPAKCWHCFMPSSFSADHCRDYHRELEELAVEPVVGGPAGWADGVVAHHLPGHSPDSLAIRVGGEALFVGDTVLPDITPWPTCEAHFPAVAGVLEGICRQAGELFGLARYLRSLKFLAKLAERFPSLAIFPAHRLFRDGRWNGVVLAGRVAELVEHHVQRCGAILEILTGAGPLSTAAVARAHFEPRLLAGYGHLMAANEVDSHCELLLAAGDLRRRSDGRWEAAGSSRFEAHIAGLSADC